MNNFFDTRFKNLSVAVLVILGLFLLVQTIVSIGSLKIQDRNIMPSKVITARGTGEALATPDIATFSFTIREEAKDVMTAQQAMSEKANKAINLLKEKGIEEKDIKTESYYTNPKYEYTQAMPCGPSYCPPSRSVLSGYEVSETVSVKVRDISKAGDLLTEVAALSIGEVSGLSLTIDSTDALQAEAKADAVAKAREDAERTAKALGVKLGKVIGFYEETPGYGYSAAYGMGGEMMSKAVDTVVVPSIAPGEQKFTSVVSVTYEIR